VDESIQVWFTSEDGVRFKLARQADLVWAGPAPTVSNDKAIASIRVDISRTYQSILGMGSSLEEATVYNLRRMPDGDRVLRSLVDPVDGIGWNLMRICFGSSDFTARAYYSYDDMPEGQTDLELAHFSIQKDVETGRPQPFKVLAQGKQFAAMLPDKTVATYCWRLVTALPC